MEYTAAELSNVLNGEIIGDENARVSTLGKIDNCGSDALAFLANPKYEQHLYTTGAAIVLVGRNVVPARLVNATLIKVDDPYAAFTRLLNYYSQGSRPERPEGIHATSVVRDGVKLGEGTAVGPQCCVEEGTVMGERCYLSAQVYIGANCSIGNNCTLYPGVKIYSDTQIGDNVTIHANAVIGSDGFGFAPQADGTFEKTPQIGNVVIGNNVEIGANTVIDRATMGSTRVHDGVKLDNLIQVAHNVEIGSNTVIASQTGISGSTKIGANCYIGGQVGIAGHLTLAPGSQLAARSGVMGDIKQPGMQWAGAPVLPFKDWLRANVIFRRLPDVEKKVHSFENFINSTPTGDNSKDGR